MEINNNAVAGICTILFDEKDIRERGFFQNSVDNEEILRWVRWIQKELPDDIKDTLSVMPTAYNAKINIDTSNSDGSIKSKIEISYSVNDIAIGKILGSIDSVLEMQNICAVTKNAARSIKEKYINTRISVSKLFNRGMEYDNGANIPAYNDALSYVLEDLRESLRENNICISYDVFHDMSLLEISSQDDLLAIAKVLCDDDLCFKNDGKYYVITAKNLFACFDYIESSRLINEYEIGYINEHYEFISNIKTLKEICK